jgi:nicotinamidase-related amidase
MDDFTRPHVGTSALVLIDVQADFLDGGPAAIAGTSERLGQMAALAAAFRAAGRPIAHVVRLYQGADVDLVRRARIRAGEALVRPGTPGADVPPDLLGQAVTLDAALLLTGRPQVLGPAEAIFFKPRWSAFHRTGLDAWLRGQGVDTVVVAGCNFPNCPRATLFDATSLDYRAVVVTDATSQVTPERLADAALIGVVPRTVADVVAALAPAGQDT